MFTFPKTCNFIKEIKNMSFYENSWKLEVKSVFGIQEVRVGVERWEMSALAADQIPCFVPITSGTCDLGGG